MDLDDGAVPQEVTVEAQRPDTDPVYIPLPCTLRPTQALQTHREATGPALRGTGIREFAHVSNPLHPATHNQCMRVRVRVSVYGR